MTPTRRDFLGAAAATAALAAIGCAPRLDEPSADFGMPMFPLSLGQWSLHRAIRSGALDPLYFAPYARDRFGFDAVDYVNTLVGEPRPSRLAEMRRIADDAGVTGDILLVDVEERLGDPEARRRDAAIAAHESWLEAARVLGCRAIRVNAYSEGTPEEQLRLCADGITRLCSRADDVDIGLLIENHGGMSSRPEWLVELIETIAHPRLHALPDFGNWEYEPGRWADRYEGVAALMPTARGISAKAHAFDANGNEMSTDYERMLRIVARGGYTGRLEVEYEGEQLSEEDGIRATIQLIRTVSPAD